MVKILSYNVKPCENLATIPAHGLFINLIITNVIMELLKVSEKVHIWQFRNKISDIKIAKMIGITRQMVSQKKKHNDFTPQEITKLEGNGLINIL